MDFLNDPLMMTDGMLHGLFGISAKFDVVASISSKVCVNKRKEEKNVAIVNRIESCYCCKNDLSKLTLGRTLKVHTSFVSAQYSPPHLRHPELLSVMA